MASLLIRTSAFSLGSALHNPRHDAVDSARLPGFGLDDGAGMLDGCRVALVRAAGPGPASAFPGVVTGALAITSA